MKILNEIEIVDLGLYFTSTKNLVVSDIHLGYEQALGLNFKVHFDDIFKRMQALLEKTKPKTVIINGDLKHSFGNILQEEWDDALEFIDLIFKYTKDVILIKGNHDKILEPIAKRKGLKVLNKIVIDNILFCHGDKIFDDNAETIVIGNEHPAVLLSDNIRREYYKCFLVGKFKNKNLIVLPSFNTLVEGTHLTDLKGPFVQDIQDFNVYIVGDKIYDFGLVRNIL